MDICGKCMGTGVAGHPDSGYTCDCNGGMTDPTPTRAEANPVTFVPVGDNDTGNAWMEWHPHGDWISLADYQALRERAEAAERDRLLMAQKYDEEHPDPALMATIIMRNIENRFVIEDLQVALTAARRAEAAAWNDAIEAAAEFACQWHKDEQPDLRDDIRALRRAAPTEGEA